MSWLPAIGAVLAMVIVLPGCGTTAKDARPATRPAAAVRHLPPDAGVALDQSQAPHGEIEQRRMTVWGEVKLILKNRHGQLPPLERKPTASEDPPHATVVNDTPFRLTVWLAGPCAHKLEIPAGSEQAAQLCAGAYAVAARVESASYLPLVREDQPFEPGMRYTLRIQIRRQPTTTRKRRWVEPPAP